MTTNQTIFNPHTLDENAFLLASHMPKGRFWESVFDKRTNLGKLVAGLAVEFYRLEVLVKEMSDEFDIRKTDKLLSEWEKSVGIPSGCLITTGKTTEDRRKQVEAVFSNFGGVQIAEDFERVAELFGFTAKVISGSTVALFPMLFPITFSASTEEAGHTIIVDVSATTSGDTFFPLPFPIPFSGGGTEFLKCIFELLAPANVQVIIST